MTCSTRRRSKRARVGEIVGVTRGRGIRMVTVGLLLRLEAKPGKETAVEEFLRDAQPLVQDEPATTAWFAVRFGPTSFGIFDVFPDDAGRQAHIAGKVAEALYARGPDLFATRPSVEQIDILAEKLPG